MADMQPYPTNGFASNSPYRTGFKPCMSSNTCRLKVLGKGVISAEPDKAVIILGVITEDIRLETAQKKNAETITAVIAAIMRLGVSRESIQTQAYNIQPIYDYIEGKSVFKGYRVTHNLKVDISAVSMVGAIIDAAVASGANNISGVDFTVSDSSEYYKAALNAAINDALGKAEVIGSKLNVYVNPIPVQIVEVRYQQAVPIIPYTVQATAQMTPIQPGIVEITAAIEAIFSYACQQ